MKIIWPVILISLLLPSVGYGQFTITARPSGRRVRFIKFTIIPPFDIGNCSYRVMSSDRKVTLNPQSPRGVSIATFRRAGSEVYLLGGPLKTPRLGIRGRKKRFKVFFRAYIYCGSDVTASNIVSLRVSKRRGTHGPSGAIAWLKRELKYHMDYDHERYGDTGSSINLNS